MAAPVPTPTLIDSIIQSVLTPGAGPGLVATINGSLLVLVLVLLAMIVCGIGEWHAAVLLCLAFGLLGSFNYFISQVREAEGTAGPLQSASGAGLPGSVPALAEPQAAGAPREAEGTRRRTQK